MRQGRILIMLFMIICKMTDGGNDYSTSEIKPSLFDHAVAITRDFESTFTVYSESRATRQVRYAVTVLNNSGNDYVEFTERYSKSYTIGILGGNIYDGNGKLLYKIKRSDFKDYSAVEGYQLYSDARVLYYKPVVNTYPYTVEYFYDVSYDGLLNYPVWMPQEAYNLSVEHSLFRIIVPDDLGLRYKELNINDPVKIIPGKTTKTYEWQINELNAIEREAYCPDGFDFVPAVLTAPNDFKYEGYEGNMESWKNYGLWTYNLLKGRDQLPPGTIEKIKTLVAGSKDKMEVITKVYEYVQSRTRYVSISLGIGGFQPMAAQKVDEVGYGDCKALSNYTKVLLKVAGIDSYYTEVRAGKNERDLLVDFPSSQTNHIILCVPLEHDTVWLECTSQTDPVGYTGNFTDDRHVLLITEQGGRIVRTNTYGQQDNTQVRTTELFIDASGKGKTVIKTAYSGLQFDNISEVLDKSPEDQKKWYYDELPLSNYTITSIKHCVEKGPVPVAYENIDLTMNTFATVTGKRMFVPLNPMNRMTSLPKSVKERKTDVVIKKPYIDTDTVIVHLPESYDIEYLPEDATWSTPFGDYSLHVSHEGDQIVVFRILKLNKIKSPPSTYNDLMTFLKNICDTDKLQAVLIKKI